MLAQVREYSTKFYNEMIEAISAKEKELVGHAERIIREQEGLKDALNGAFISNMVGVSECVDGVGPVLQ